MSSTLRFRNAAAITMDVPCPQANTVLVEGNRIVWVGDEKDAPHTRADRVIDCAGATLLPGLSDAHIHLLAYAASLLHMDCSRRTVSSITDLHRLIGSQAQTTPAGQWLRGVGYDEFHLAEKRHPTRYDLDPAAPRHPVRLDHRSSHACVLSSLGLREVGITADTPDPVDGVIVRDDSGEPTGLLLEMNSYVSQRMPQQNQNILHQSVDKASRQLLAWGITSLQDATPGNGLEQWKTLLRLTQAGAIRQRLTFMPGIHHLQQFTADGLTHNMGGSTMTIGPTKLVATLTTGALHPPEGEIRRLVHEAHQAGSPVAVHAVEHEVVMTVTRVLKEASAGSRISPHRDRIEHCSEATPDVLEQLTDSGITVVTQPGFLYESGERYHAEVPAELQPWLYPLNALRQAGVPLAAGSDAPVASPNPWQGLYAAVTRRDSSGLALHPEQSISIEEALALWTSGAAYAAGQEQTWGMLRSGMLADLVLLDRDVTRAPPEELLTCPVAMTIMGGDVVWEA
ncbi:MAG: amidohydrolase [Chloroflexi bacterium]|nr:amidohydrolase [Chloroflexota bacterium]